MITVAKFILLQKLVHAVLNMYGTILLAQLVHVNFSYMYLYTCIMISDHMTCDFILLSLCACAGAWFISFYSSSGKYEFQIDIPSYYTSASSAILPLHSIVSYSMFT